MLSYITQHKIKSAAIGALLICIVYMGITGTLSYPYILVDRQIELLKYCSKGTTEFDTKDFGFHISAPAGYCILPHRIFPADGSIQIVPAGKYSVINEYAKGTIIGAAQATILFEKTEEGRSPEQLLEKMRQGGFLKEAKITEFTNKQNLRIVLATNTTGLDTETNPHFNWAFVVHPNGKVMTSVLTAHPETPETFNYILDHLSAIQ